MVKELNIELIEKEYESFTVESNSYINSYAELVNYFRNIDTIEKHHLVISSHFVYGWMPTIINLKQDNLTEVLRLLNQAKKGILLSPDEIAILKDCINNSMVGLSKLLHFIHPDTYAIWDSRIFKFLTGKKSTYGIDKPAAYLKYLQELKIIAENPAFDRIHAELQEHYKYPISKLRAIEVVIFQSKTELAHFENI